MSLVDGTKEEERKSWTSFISCRQVLNILVILGFMVNYMLRVNLTIAIVAMVKPRNMTENVTDVEQDETFVWDKYEQNLVLGCFFWGYLLTEVPGGRLAELFGSKRVFGYAMLASSVLTVFTPTAALMGPMVLAGLRALLGFFLGATWPAMPPMAAKWIPPLERSKFIANMMASSLGAAITMPICGWLIEMSGWKCVFYVTGAIGLVWSLAWFVLVFDSPAQHPRISAKERRLIEGAIAAGDGANVRPKKFPWRAILTSAPVWAIVLTHALNVFGYFTVIHQLPTYMKEVLNQDISHNGIFSSLPYLGKYMCAVAASALADRLRSKGVLTTTQTRKTFTSFAVLIPFFLMVVQAIFGYDFTISVVMLTTALTVNGAVTAGYLANGLDIAPNYCGTIMGLSNTLSSVGGFLSTMIVAELTLTDQSFEQWRFVFWMLAATYLAGGLIFLIFSTGERQSWNSDSRRTAEDADGNAEAQPLQTR